MLALRCVVLCPLNGMLCEVGADALQVDHMTKPQTIRGILGQTFAPVGETMFLGDLKKRFDFVETRCVDYGCDGCCGGWVPLASLLQYEKRCRNHAHLNTESHTKNRKGHV